MLVCFFFQEEDGIRELVRSRGLGDVYKRQRFHRAFLRQRPDAIAVWNGGHWFFQAAIRAAREFAIPVFYCENGLLPDTTTFDPRGINYHNAVPRAAAFYRALAPMPPLTRTSLVARKPVRGCSAQPLTLPCLLYTSPSPRDRTRSRMPSSA